MAPYEEMCLEAITLSFMPRPRWFSRNTATKLVIPFFPEKDMSRISKALVLILNQSNPNLREFLIHIIIWKINNYTHKGKIYEICIISLD